MSIESPVPVPSHASAASGTRDASEASGEVFVSPGSASTGAQSEPAVGRPAVPGAAADRRTQEGSIGAFAAVDVPDLVDVIEGELTRAIVEGALKPGQRVVEADLARRMGISRAPLREAARRLERQGILVARPRRGFFVRDITVKEIDDLYYVRVTLERSAVMLACERIDATGLDRLQALIDAMVDKVESLPPLQRIAMDLQFHRMLCAASENARLIRLFGSVETEVRMVIALLDNVYQDPLEVARSHQPILDALRRRDAVAAAGELEIHVNDGWRHVRSLFTSQHGQR